MHHVKTVALAAPSFTPRLYRRYIDDIIMGPLVHDDNFFIDIVTTFNSVVPEINFTIEAPNPDGWLPFLDFKVKIINGQIMHDFYRKDCHSTIFLRKDSYVPAHVKSNFIKNKYNTIRNRSSDPQLCEESVLSEESVC